MDRTMPHARALVSEAGPELLARMRHDLANLAPMPPAERLDGLLRDQEGRWQEGECVGAEVYRQAAPQVVGDDDTLLYLISGELHLRGKLGERLNPAEYRGRFPHLGDTIARQIEVETALLSQEATGEIPSLATATGTFDKEGPEAVSTDPTTVPGFEVLGELGRGGMGVVYKAKQKGLNRLVALKMVLPEKGPSRTARQRFQQEAEHIAALQHPNIVQVYQFGEHAGNLFFALEYVPGGSLAERLQREGHRPWKPREAARLVQALAGAMAYAHERGTIHRDLKPGNVLLDENGQPRLTDFGLARQAVPSGLTLDGAIMGTPAYMAPEQALGDREKIGPAADVFGLGAILYQLLTGRPPYQGPDVRSTIKQAERGQYWPVRELNPEVPVGLARVVEKALAADVNARYRTAHELEQALAAWLRPINWWLIGGAAVAALLLLGAGSVLAATRPWERGAAEEVVEGDNSKEEAPPDGRGGAKPQIAGKAEPNPKARPEPAPPEAPLNGDFRLMVYSKTDPDRRGLVLTDDGVLPVREKELIQFEAEFNRKAYVYVLWVDGKGQIDAFYPWDREEGPDALKKPSPKVMPRTRVRMPPEVDRGFPMLGESGLETVILMARETPLPPDVRLDLELGHIPRAPLTNPGEITVRGTNVAPPANLKKPREERSKKGGGGIGNWERAQLRGKAFEPANGVRRVEMVLHDIKRAPGKAAEVIDEPVLKLMRKVSKHFDVVRVVRFAYQQ